MIAYPGNKIPGFMSDRELGWLFQNASRFQTVCELGSWKGRSTHALCSGCPGLVVAVDHFLGSTGDAKSEPYRPSVVGDNVYREFLENMKGFKNLLVDRRDTIAAASSYKNGEFEMLFIDADHPYSAILADLVAWKPKVTRLICGHDYSWKGVKQAVTEQLGTVNVIEQIWWKDLP